MKTVKELRDEVVDLIETGEGKSLNELKAEVDGVFKSANEDADEDVDFVEPELSKKLILRHSEPEFYFNEDREGRKTVTCKLYSSLEIRNYSSVSPERLIMSAIRYTNKRDKFVVKYTATCQPEDEYSEEKGKKIALYGARAKAYLKAESVLADAVKMLSTAVVQADFEAERYGCAFEMQQELTSKVCNE